MTRLAWRQFRLEAFVGAGALAVVAIVLGVTGPDLVNVFRHAPAQLPVTDHALQVAVAALLLVAPAVVGMFFGAPLVARELESGTFRLAWTQTVTRSRWFAVKLVLVGLCSSLLIGGLSLLAAWWANPVDIFDANRFSPSNFQILGIVPFGYALFATAFGAAAGVLLRRTLPAAAVTLLGYIGVRYAVTFWVRPHLAAPIRAKFPLATGGLDFLRNNAGKLVIGTSPPVIPNGWGLSATIVDDTGHAPSTAEVIKDCPFVTGSPTSAAHLGGSRHSAPAVGDPMQTCIATLAKKFHDVVVYQPASRYWSFQIEETLLFVLAAVALGGLALWWLRRRLV